MRLKESFSYKNRFINDTTDDYIGKCVYVDIKYWYININNIFIKKDTTCLNKSSINRYWL